MQSRLASFFRTHALEGVISAYLFGSHAAGRAHRESDVDVGVLLDWSRYPDARARFELRVQLGSDLAPAVGHNDVDVVVLNDTPSELGRRVVTQGVRLFCTDPEADHAYVRDVQLRAADVAPWLARMRRVKLEALRV